MARVLSPLNSWLLQWGKVAYLCYKILYDGVLVSINEILLFKYIYIGICTSAASWESLSDGATCLNFNHNFKYWYHGRNFLWGLWLSRSLFMRTLPWSQSFLMTATKVAVFLWGLLPWSQSFLRTGFYEDCCHGRSLFLRTATIFLRTATMVAVLITLKIYDFSISHA